MRIIKNKHLFWTLFIVFAVLLFDQILKVWVKTHMLIGESSYTNWNWHIKWFQLLFVENKGMAFGMQLPGQNGKILLTLLRIVIISGIGYYMVVLIKKHAPIPLLITLSLIFAGAAGNLIDCLFYGLIFTKSPEIYTIGQTILPATTTPFGHGYSSFLFGNVVDMLYFPLFSVKIPDFIPIWGGTNFSFFDPIFNIADASITCGVIVLLFFSRKWFRILEAIDSKQKQEITDNVVNN